jgi:hypothetical protein
MLLHIPVIKNQVTYLKKIKKIFMELNEFGTNLEELQFSESVQITGGVLLGTSHSIIYWASFAIGFLSQLDLTGDFAGTN